MREYTFTAKTSDGVIVKDVIKAKSRYDAMGLIKQKGLVVISLSPNGTIEVDATNTAKLVKKRKKRLSRPARISLSEFSVFCRQLSVCISSGINLMDSLQAIAEDMDNLVLRKTLFNVIGDIRQGKSFSDAAAGYKHVFNPLFCGLMKAAEESGSMKVVLEYLSVYLEKTVQLHRKICSIAAYPAFIAAFFIIVVLVVTLFILPKFESLFSQFGASLPLITRVVFSVNRFFIRYFPVMFIIGIGLVTACILYVRTKKGRYYFDGLKLKMAILGALVKKSSMARFCRVLAVTIRGGVPIVTAMSVASDTCGNKVLEQALRMARNKIVEGANIAQSLSKSQLFPRLMVRMIGIGESSGRLPYVLDNVSAMYEDEVEGTITVGTAIFEPIMIVFFGIVVLILILAVYVPVFKLATAMRSV